MENRFIFNIDIKQNIVNNIKFQQGDLKGSVLEAHLMDNSVAKDITGATVEFRFLKPDKTVVYQNSDVSIDQVTILDATNGIVECILNPDALSQTGILKCEINLKSSDGSEVTIPYFKLTVNSSIGIDGVLSSSYISAIETIKNEYETALHENTSIELVKARHDDINNIDYNDVGSRLNAHETTLSTNTQQIGINTTTISALQGQVNGAINGSPIPITLASQMTDHTKNYTYFGTESGYMAGDIYYWDITASKFVDSGKQYQTSGIATEGILHLNYKKNSVTSDVLGASSTLRDIADYTPYTGTWLSGYITCPNVVLTTGEIQVEVKIGTASSGYLYLLEKNADNSVKVKASLAYNFVVGINTINTGFIADGNGKEYIGIYGGICSSTSGTGTGYYWSITTSTPTNTTFTANAVSPNHNDPALKIKTLGAIGTNHIKDSIITLPKLASDVISRFTNVEQGLLYGSNTPKTVDFSTTTMQSTVTNSTHPTTNGRLWGCLNIPLTTQGNISVTIKAVKAVSEYIVLLKKVSGTSYTIIDKQLISIPIGINTISTNLQITADGEYYIAITDRVSNSSNGTSGNLYCSNSSSGNSLMMIFDFDISTRTSVSTDNTDGTVLSNFMFGLQVTLTTTLKQAISGLSENTEIIPTDIIYTEKFLSLPSPPYGNWVEVGTGGVFSNGYTPVANSSFANYIYLNQVTNFDTDTTKWRIQINDITSKFRIARIATILTKTTTVEFDNGTLRLYGASTLFGFSTTSTVLTSKTLTMPIVAGREYIFTLENFGFVVRFEITDTVTGDSEYIQYDSTNQASAGLCMDYPLISLASGNITVKQFDYFTKYNRSPKLIIIGDSLVEGMTIQNLGGWKARWAYQVYQALNGNCAILGVGSETTTTFIPKLPVLQRTFYRPEYVLLGLMTNDTDFNTWKTNTEKLIAWTENLGATPIFGMMMKNKMTTDFYNSVLNYVTNSKYKIINFNRALSVNGDGVTPIPDYQISGDIHPNQAGHNKMFKQVQADLGEIFPLDYQ